LLIADLYIYFKKGANVKMLLKTVKKALLNWAILRFLAKWNPKIQSKNLEGTPKPIYGLWGTKAGHREGLI